MPSFAFFKKKRKQDIPDRSPFSAGSPQPQPSKPAQRPSAAASPVNLSGPAAAALAHPTVSAHPSPVSSSSAASSSVAPPSPAMISVLDHLDGNAAPSSRAAASATPPPQAAPSSAPPQQHKTAAAVAQPPSNAPTIQSLLNASPDAAPAAAPPAATVAASPSPGNNPASLAAAPSSHPHGSAASTIATSSSSMAGLLQQQPGLQPAPAQPQLLQYLPQQQAAQQAALRETKGKYALTDFALQRTLGTGSFGRVHLVQSRHNSRFYAVKVLKKAQVVKMKQVEHTNDERRMLQRVKHPFLITLWGTFQDAKNLYMVMDFVEGGELFSLLRKSQRFPNPVAKFYAAEVVLALDYLHGMNIVYRDLKPENLLLDRHGHLKITDFGFAKEVPDITWTLCGTPDYLAPEVVASKGYNKSVDWWSLGILIFEMLCGYTPFWDGGSPMKIYENILKGRVKYPPYVEPDAQDLLGKLITADLTKRLGNLVGGSKDVMHHAWFAEVTWDRLLKKDIDAPFTPPIKGGVGDASQFDKYPEETEVYGQTGEDPYHKYFTEF